MATSQEYLREIASRVDPEYAGALRDAADLIDWLQLDVKNVSQSYDAVLRAADAKRDRPELNHGCIVCGENHPSARCLYRLNISTEP